MKQAEEHLRSVDPQLREIMESVSYPEYANTYDVFEDLSSCILDMRIHYAPTPSAFRYPRLKGLLQGATMTPEFILNPDEHIWATLKLSRQKDESLKLWARAWLENDWDNLDWASLPEKEVYHHLMRIKGISEWTVQMVLLFTLERPDIFPSGDYQLRKAMCNLYDLPEDDQVQDRMAQIATAWKPYRSLGTRYLWAWRAAKKKGLKA